MDWTNRGNAMANLTINGKAFELPLRDQNITFA
jgi:hypothetical protein